MFRRSVTNAGSVVLFSIVTVAEDDDAPNIKFSSSDELESSLESLVDNDEEESESDEEESESDEEESESDEEESESDEEESESDEEESESDESDESDSFPIIAVLNFAYCCSCSRYLGSKE